MDVEKPDEISNVKTLLVKNIVKEWKTFLSKLTGDRFNNSQSSHVDTIRSITCALKFNTIEALTCKHTFSGHTQYICALQPYILNGKQYLASTSLDKTILLWNLSVNKVADTLKAYNSRVHALAVYIKNGIPMLASAHCKWIRLWNLSDKMSVAILSGHESYVDVLTVYEKGNESILISGGYDKTIKL